MRQQVFPFIVGCPRSGTTLLRAMLDSHSQLAIPGESHFIVRMARGRDRYAIPTGFAADAFVDDLLADVRFQGWGIAPRSARETLDRAEPTNLADALRAVYRAYASHRGKLLYGDKTPGYVRELPLLAELFPEARFVHVVRDGRDVALSLRDMDWAQRGGLDTLAGFWRTNVELAFAARGQLGTRRYLEVRYERLVDDPASVLADVCAFLELPYEPAMVSYHERMDELARSLRAGDHTRLRLPPTKGLRDWRTQMSSEEVTRFEEVAGEALEQAGYRRATEDRAGNPTERLARG